LEVELPGDHGGGGDDHRPEPPSMRAHPSPYAIHDLPCPLAQIHSPLTALEPLAAHGAADLVRWSQK
jgi:hypothetical protein